MTKEQQVISKQVEELKEVINQLISQRTELDYRIEELRNVKDALLRLLPVDQRIDNLFS